MISYMDEVGRRADSDPHNQLIHERQDWSPLSDMKLFQPFISIRRA